jgi:hypothetical protein
MKTQRAILSGALVWILVLTLFGVMDLVPYAHASTLLQGIIASILIVPFALIAARFYYKGGDQTNGLSVGLVMIATALMLDVLITVPLIEQPYHGTNHRQFFSNPLLWTIVAEVLIVTTLYHRLKIARA